MKFKPFISDLVFSRYASKQGFTLVELLIVIALIGALAVGLLAAIDPIEQIRRGQDTGVRNLAREVAQAQSRYFTARGNYSWGTAALAVGNLSATNQATAITALISAGELKSNFVTQAGNNASRIFLSGSALDSNNNQTVAVCFLPNSKNMAGDPTAVSTNVGAAVASGCPVTSGAQNTACHICFN